MNLKRISLACAAMLFLASFSFGQARDVGTYVGTVYDTEGITLPGATLTAKNVETGLTRTVITNERGQYRLERLPRGFYIITVSLPGFKTSERGGLELWAGAELRVDFTLEVGAIEEKITVIAVSPIVETTRTQVSTIVTEREMLSYPQGNRNFLSLMAYAPGTLPGAGRSGYAINGMRGSSNNFMIDGIDNNDQGTASDDVTTLPPEAIQEFRLIANNFSAEYGRNAGGVINAVMKSGTNELHGSGWVFHRGDSAAFQSADPYTHDRPPYKRWMYGGTLGGPIIRDKTFFFASFEGTWQKEEARTPYLWWTQEAIAKAPAGSAARYFFDTYGAGYPTPGAPYYDIDDDGSIDAGEYVWDGTSIYKGYKFALKIDHIMGERDRLAFRWLYNYYSEVEDFANVPGFERDLPWYYHTGGLTWLHLFSPTMYNELRVGYHRDYANWERVAPEIPNLGGYTVFNDGVHAIGDWPNMPQKFVNNTFQLVDVLNFQLGNHSVKVGGEIRYWTSDSIFDAMVDGYYQFDTSLDFLYDLGSYFLYIGADPPDPPADNPYAAGPATDPWGRGDTSRKWKGIEGGLFIQDDWRITDRLTISAGLRWEYFGVPKEWSGKGINMPAFGTEQGFLNTVAGNIDITEGVYNREGLQYAIWDGREKLGKGLWNEYYGAFAPKFSFAYDLTGDGKTSLRGGVAIAYDRTFNNTYENDRFNYPDFTFVSFFSPTSAISPTIPASIPMALISRYRVALRWMTPDMKPQRAYNWMIGFQREIAPNVGIEINYTGSHGANLGSIQRPNRFTGDGLDGTYDGLNPYGAIRDLNVREQTLRSNYHSFQVVITKRFSNGWSWYSAYTFGFAKDQNSDYFGDNTTMEAVDHWRLDDEYGYAQFDRRHRLVGGFVWDIPWFKGSENWFVKNVVAGWQLSANFHYTSGEPFSVGMFSLANDWNLDGNDYERPIWDPSNTGADYRDILVWDGVTPGLDTSLFGVPDPPIAVDDAEYYQQNFVDRNAFRWFPEYNINIALQKYFTVPIGGRDVTIQVIGEIFNLFKNTFWDVPYTSMTHSRYGTTVDKDGVRRLQLSMRIMF